jgi:hypothetical protein
MVLTGTGVAATGATASVGSQAVNLPLQYSCVFPAGSALVNVQLAAAFPAAGVTGRPIQPAGVAITATLPHAMVGYLGSLKTAAVRVTADLGVEVTENQVSAITPWQGLTAPLAPLPAKGGLAASVSGAVPSVTISAAGDAAFTAGGLSLVLTSYKAGGHATNPPSMVVTCNLRPGQSAALATVAVTGGTGPVRDGSTITVGSQPGASHTAAGVGAAPKTCPPLPPGGLPLNPRFPPPPPEPGSQEFHGPQTACAYIAGFTNVKKLNEASLIGPGLTKLDIATTIFAIFPAKPNHKYPLTGNYIQTQNVAQLDYQGKHEFPPATATLLGFGFVPVSATLQLTEIGTINAITVGPEVPSECLGTKVECQQVVTVSSRVNLRIYDVTVNGVPLNVGDHCESATPFDIIAKGLVPAYTVPTGGTLTGTATIPPFKGCSDGSEDLDPIFTASVSGPGNQVLLTQAAPCFPGSTGCPPCKPVPKHAYSASPPQCQTALAAENAGRRDGN